MKFSDIFKICATMNLIVFAAAMLASIANAAPTAATTTATTTASVSVTTTASASPTVCANGFKYLGKTVGYADVFSSIRYAEKAVRFSPPVAVSRPRTEQFYNATITPNACVQNHLDSSFPAGTVISEDCLFLNIHKPHNATSELLPVWVYIHGGTFTSGGIASILYDGSHILQTRSDIIIVTISYRLGVFGFSASEELAAKGALNLGLLDQEAAFHWIQKNIWYFGGDPTRVTATGQSAGGISLGTLLTSRGGNNVLFHQVGLQSGSAFTFAAPISFSQPFFNSLVSTFNCTSASDAVSCLKTVNATLLQAAGSQYSYYQPVVDGVFLTQAPYVALRQGLFRKVPLLAGDVKDDGLIFIPSTNETIAKADFATIISQQFASLPVDDLAFLNATTYANYAPPVATSWGLGAGNFTGDYRHKCNDNLAIKLFAQYGLPVHKYLLSTCGTAFAYNYGYTKSPLPALHGCDICFVFNDPTCFYTAAQAELGVAMSNAWADFAAGKLNQNSLGWEPYTLANPTEIVFNIGNGTNFESILDDGGEPKCEGLWEAGSLTYSLPVNF
ncbi:hypothetical protein HK100_012592 [Physocladia obscura]|uniref:Carboxylesterase type B domain-containing protein n=1 Tax=Physocladia obscura TaxID=109957 RepID=A0AAD5SZJ0_9FUNG|nr:hypothetical protein HK100_012592 [Physocladia obscura]